MAYLVELATICVKCRKVAAVVELKNRVNASLGCYCRTCGEQELKAQQKQEDGR